MDELFPLKWCCTDTAFDELIKNTILKIFLIWHMICVIRTHTFLLNQYHMFHTFRKKVLYNLIFLQENRKNSSHIKIPFIGKIVKKM